MCEWAKARTTAAYERALADPAVTVSGSLEEGFEYVRWEGRTQLVRAAVRPVGAAGPEQ